MGPDPRDLPPAGAPQEPAAQTPAVKTQGLARVIAKTGRATRRQAEAMVRSGRVRVNGRPVVDPAFPVSTGMAVRIDGELLGSVARRYYAFHKPINVVSVHAKRDRRRAMADFFPPEVLGLRPAGRLDPDTTGLVLVSNDAGWNDHAAGGAGFEKEYLVRVSGAVSELELGVLATGLHLPKLGFVRPARIEIEVADEQQTTLRIVMLDAKNRQIRRLLQALRHEILSLHRVRIGPVLLEDLPAGHLRPLRPEEIEQIRLGGRPKPRRVRRSAAASPASPSRQEAAGAPSLEVEGAGEAPDTAAAEAKSEQMAPLPGSTADPGDRSEGPAAESAAERAGTAAAAAEAPGEPPAVASNVESSKAGPSTGGAGVAADAAAAAGAGSTGRETASGGSSAGAAAQPEAAPPDGHALGAPAAAEGSPDRGTKQPVRRKRASQAGKPPKPRPRGGGEP